ncbi:MAG: glycosyltransferase family 2 protein [Clostridia bacterium]|nr:glycosyltransferase family 2 protein [Clostridia bacterium]
MPKYSIVVPVYNAEKYLEECVNSVLSQSVTDFELILVDDGSTDNSGRMCDSFASCDERVKVIHQQNSGPIPTRFNGVKEASGDYILSLDSDDYWLDGLLEKVDESINRFACDMLIFRLQKGSAPCHEFWDGEREKVDRGEFFQTSLRESGMNSIVIKVCDRSLFENVDISSVMSVRNSEDLLISTMLARKAKKISYIPDVLYFYRTNDTNISSRIDRNALEEYMLSRTAVWRELERLGLDNDDNRKLLNTGFLRRVADLVLQMNCSCASRQEKLQYISELADNEDFVRIMQSADLSQLGKAKQLRLKLLYSHRFSLLIMLDTIRTKVR